MFQDEICSRYENTTMTEDLTLPVTKISKQEIVEGHLMKISEEIMRKPIALV
jgi:hypothetical protein